MADKASIDPGQVNPKPPEVYSLSGSGGSTSAEVDFIVCMPYDDCAFKDGEEVCCHCGCRVGLSKSSLEILNYSECQVICVGCAMAEMAKAKEVAPEEPLEVLVHADDGPGECDICHGWVDFRIQRICNSCRKG